MKNGFFGLYQEPGGGPCSVTSEGTISETCRFVTRAATSSASLLFDETFNSVSITVTYLLPYRA